MEGLSPSPPGDSWVAGIGDYQGVVDARGGGVMPPLLVCAESQMRQEDITDALM